MMVKSRICVTKSKVDELGRPVVLGYGLKNMHGSDKPTFPALLFKSSVGSEVKNGKPFVFDKWVLKVIGEENFGKDWVVVGSKRWDLLIWYKMSLFVLNFTERVKQTWYIWTRRLP